MNDVLNAKCYNLPKLLDKDNTLFDACDYSSINDLPREIDNFNFKVMHLNIWSLLGKIDSLNSILYELNTKKCNINVVCLNETHLNDSKASLCKIPGYKLEFLNRSTKANGSVAIWIHDTLKYRCRLDLDIFEEGIFESCFVKIEGKFKRNILVGSIYRVPNTNEKHFISTYREMAIKLKSEDKEIIIGTDQNMDYLKVYTHHNTLDLLDTNLDLKLFPTILRPTRITNTTATLIDNIYLSKQWATKYLSFILDCDISDHLPCLTVFNKQHKKMKDPLNIKNKAYWWWKIK